MNTLLLCALLLSASDGEGPNVYCGVHSLYAAMSALDVDLDVAELLEPRYVSSFRGSTVADLERAASDHGVHATALQEMTTDMLRDSPAPVLLHAKLARRGSLYRHWLCYLGTDGDLARIVDPPNSAESVPFAEISSLWDGVGVVVSREPVSMLRLTRAGWLEKAVTATVACLALLVAFILLRGTRRLAAGVAGLVGCGAALARVGQGLTTDGFWRNSTAVANVVTTHHASHLPQLDYEQFRQRAKGAIVIDSRFFDDYQSGHITGALSIPITENSSGRTRLLENIPRDAPVILYCQSEGCGFSDELGSDLIFRGYKNVAVYRGGYADWESRQAP